MYWYNSTPDSVRYSTLFAWRNQLSCGFLFWYGIPIPEECFRWGEMKELHAQGIGTKKKQVETISASEEKLLRDKVCKVIQIHEPCWILWCGCVDCTSPCAVEGSIGVCVHARLNSLRSQVGHHVCDIMKMSQRSSSSLPSGTNKQTCDHRQLLLCVMGWEYIARGSWGQPLGKGAEPL